MDLEFLLSNAAWFAYELRKFFPETETPVANYTCKEHVVVLSNQKLYVFFYQGLIDYRGKSLKELELINVDTDKFYCEVTIGNKEFKLQFKSEKDFGLFNTYFNKYKE